MAKLEVPGPQYVSSSYHRDIEHMQTRIWAANALYLDGYLTEEHFMTLWREIRNYFNMAREEAAKDLTAAIELVELGG